MADLSGYKKEELTINLLKAQFMVFIYLIPSLIIFGISFYILWDNNFSRDVFNNSLSFLGAWKTPVIFAVLILSMIVHELIHGITWSGYAEGGSKSIRYGVAWKYLTPYCHCKEPLTLKHYITGAAMPGIILGIIPTIISLFTGSIVLFVFGMLMLLGAGGDLMVINKIRNKGKDNYVQDHPSRMGCFIYSPIKI